MKPKPFSRLALAALFVLAASAGIVVTVACPPPPPGQDPVVVRAQQSYLTARDACDLLFNLELNNRARLEQMLPGIHAKVNVIRTSARTWLPELKKQIDLYRKGGVHDFTYALSSVETLIVDVQAILAQAAPPPVAAPTPSAMYYQPGALDAAWVSADGSWNELSRSNDWDSLPGTEVDIVR